jgi:hypothetical protein
LIHAHEVSWLGTELRDAGRKFSTLHCGRSLQV